MRYIKKWLLIILCFCFSFVLEAQKINFTPQWSAQSQFAGFYAAKKLGFYKQAGLSVNITYPFISENSNSKLENKSSDIVTMNLMQALYYRAKGHKIVNIMQLSHQGSYKIVSHFPIKGVQSFAGKKLAIWNYLDHGLIENLTNRFGKELEVIKFNYGVNLFLSKAVDATIASSYDEIIQLRQCGFVFTDDNVVDLSVIGLNIPEDGVYVTEEYYNKNREVIRKFVNATIKGWLWVRSNTAEAVNIVLEETTKNKLPKNLYMQKQMLDEILRLQHNPNADNKLFVLTEAEFDRVSVIFFKTEKNVSIVKYNDFVKL